MYTWESNNQRVLWLVFLKKMLQIVAGVIIPIRHSLNRANVCLFYGWHDISESLGCILSILAHFIVINPKFWHHQFRQCCLLVQCYCGAPFRSIKFWDDATLRRKIGFFFKYFRNFKWGTGRTCGISIPKKIKKGKEGNWLLNSLVCNASKILVVFLNRYQ